MLERAVFGPFVLAFGGALLVACGHATPALPIALGPYSYATTDALFSATVDAVREAGYEPQTADAASGLIVLTSRVRIRGDEPPRLVVQLFREGWIRCDAELPETAREAHHDRAAREAETLAIRVLDGLHDRGFSLAEAP